MTKIFDVCVRGDGVVGRTLALLLAKERLRVALVTHPATARTQDVRAYALNSASRQLLEGLRVWPDESFATPMTDMFVWGDDGGAIDFKAQNRTPGAAQPALAWIVDVPELERQLTQACSYQSLIETVDDKVNNPCSATLSVICEGQTSSSRAAMGVQWTKKPYSQRAIAARLESDVAHGGAARQWFAGGEVLALLPMAGSAGNSLALVWSVSDERAAVLETMPPAEFCAALAAVCIPGVGNLRLTSERLSWPLALGSADRWVGPGWALAGDAAHTVHPLAGQGLNLGLADAACLSSTLAAREYWRSLGDEKLLRRYERSRRAGVATVGVVTDGLQRLFAQTQPGWQSLRNSGMNGFSAVQPLKNWLIRRAAGLPQKPTDSA